MAGSGSVDDDAESLVQQLAREPQADRRRRLLLGHRSAWRPELVRKLYDGTVQLAHRDLRQAERLARAAAWISERLDDESSRAEGLRAIGHVFFLKRKYPAAWERYDAALGIYQRLGQDLETGRTLTNALSTLMYLGRYDEALDAAQQARAIFARHGDCLRLARLDTNTANVLNRQGRFEEALKLYQGAHTAFLKIGEPNDVAIALRNLAACHINLTDFPHALQTYREAREYCDRYQMPLLATEADYNIAYLYYVRGEYERATDLYRATRDRCQAAGDAYHEGLCDLDESEMYLELNMSEEGVQLAERALQIFRRLGTGYEAAKAVTNLAVSASREGNTQDALRLFRKARSLFVRERNRVWTATVDLYQALVFYEERKFADAERLCNRAFEFLRTSPLQGKSALCQLLLARIRLADGKPIEAKRTCLDAFRSLENTESPVLHYQAWFVLASIEEALDSMDEAQEAYLRAYELLEDLRSYFHAEEMRIGFLKDKLAVYESLAGLQLSRASSPEDYEAAFLYIERAKSRALAELIALRAHQSPQVRPNDRPSARPVAELREQLSWLSRTIQVLEERSDSNLDPRLEKYRSDARQCERRLIEAFTRLRAEDPEFSNLQSAASVDVEQIRSALADDATLLEYFTIRGTLHLCLLSRRGLKVIALGPMNRVDELLRLLRFQISKFRFSKDYARSVYWQLAQTTNHHLKECYRMLLAPVEDDLRAGHLIIAPHGVLHYLPFHALYDGEQYLGSRFSISYTPSASVYYLCGTYNPRNSGCALVLGVPDSSTPHIEEEVQAVASVLPGAEVHVGAAASEGVFRAKAPGSRFIHIATHGRFRQDNPMFSSIDLSDSRLSLLDLYQMSLPAELVTLSGCGTGLNVVVGGDELLGLVRGLLYAGSQSALGTLWDVNDHSTAKFMKWFYRCLSSGVNKATAAQRAMAHVREEYPHPFHWAPFVLVGQYR